MNAISQILLATGPTSPERAGVREIVVLSLLKTQSARNSLVVSDLGDSLFFNGGGSRLAEQSLAAGSLLVERKFPDPVIKFPDSV